MSTETKNGSEVATPVRTNLSALILAQQRAEKTQNPLATPSNQEKYQLRLGSSLTPQIVSAILRRADQGYMDAIADMLDEVRETDPHLQATLFKREAQVAGAPWEIRPQRSTPGAFPKRGRKPKRDRVVEFVTEAFENIPCFSQTIAHLQSAVYHGRAASEVIWKRASNGKILPDCVEPIHPRRLSYSALNWKLHLWDSMGGMDSQFTKWPGIPFENFPKGKFIVHTPRIRGGYPTREGLGRNLVWYSVFKRWTQRDWMSLAEMSGRPGRVGYYSVGMEGKPEATPEDIELLKQALNNWSSSIGVTLPESVKLAFEHVAAGQSELHKVLVDHCNAEMSKCTLGETLTTEAGTRGARSLGDVHNDIRLMIALWDAKCIAETIRYCLIVPLVLFNFPSGTPIPEIAFTVAPAEDLNALAIRYKTLAESGLDLGQEYVRDVFGTPEPMPGEKLLIPRAPAKVLADGTDSIGAFGTGMDGEPDMGAMVKSQQKSRTGEPNNKSGEENSSEKDVTDVNE